MSIASSFDLPSSENPLILINWSFGLSLPSLLAAPPLITVLTKIPKSTEFSESSKRFVLPLTLTPRPAEPVSLSAIS
ncbi:hypothetical protein BpHYR1_033251 [Brachionus plicatilis]|uniref:Uncharacterized protein n=1 Tax=Brachionus plicatilis TaxID=10195 RepID=A0A3M7PHY1_BRAPC|nr:hypothetical protein BpHYR1_033251 [Brachionus plicatilis]